MLLLESCRAWGGSGGGTGQRRRPRRGAAATASERDSSDGGDCTPSPIRGKNPETTDKVEYALSRLDILSDKPDDSFWSRSFFDDVGADKPVDDDRPSSRRTRRPSICSDWTTTDSEQSEETS
ncbi:hypothetical protein ABZP36_009085 [Zizania latifolia]